MGEAALRGQVTMILRRRTRPGITQQQMPQHHTMPTHLMTQQTSSLLNNTNITVNNSGGLLQYPAAAALQPMRNNVQAVRYPYDVIVTRHENEGFGFVIISSSNQYYGSTIGKYIREIINNILVILDLFKILLKVNSYRAVQQIVVVNLKLVIVL